MKAAVRALIAVPEANASWVDETIVVHHAINIGYVVSLEDDGLVIPVIRDADHLSITGLMRSLRDVVERAKDHSLTHADLSGGTFTLNNTGPLGTTVVTAIVVPNQSAIVTSESIVKRVVVTGEDVQAVRSTMNLVVGFDHRILDGSAAARFLRVMKQSLESVSVAALIFDG